MHLIFFHGWGFSRSCWKKWTFSEEDTAHFFDRGYFGNPDSLDQPALWKNESVVFTHSFGLHFLAKKDLSQVKKLIVFGGFIHITTQKTTKDTISRLIKSLKKFPKLTLERFYQECGVEQEVQEAINLPLLIDDLMALKTKGLDVEALKQIPEILLVHGTDDRIAPLEKAIELHKLLSNSRLVTLENQSHALPKDFVWSR